MSVNIRDVRIPAKDGFSLAGTVYEPDGGDGRAAVLIGSATAVPRRFYDKFARFLASEGSAVVTLDYRGVGEARPASLKGFSAAMRDWGEQDIAGAIDWITNELRPDRLGYIGHSAGGQMIGLAPNNEAVSAMVAVASQSGYWRLFNAPEKYRIYLFLRLFPVIAAAFGYMPGKLGLGEDLPAGVALEWARWCLTPGYLFGDETVASRGNAARLRARILAFSLADDDWAPPRAVEDLMRHYVNANTNYRHVAPKEVGAGEIGHFGFFKEKCRETLWRESSEWLRAGQ